MSVRAVEQTAALLMQCGNPHEASRILGFFQWWWASFSVSIRHVKPHASIRLKLCATSNSRRVPNGNRCPLEWPPKRADPFFNSLFSRHHGTQRDESGNQNADSGQMLRQKLNGPNVNPRSTPRDDSYRQHDNGDANQNQNRIKNVCGYAARLRSLLRNRL